MKLTAEDVGRMVDESIPKPRLVHSAGEYIASNGIDQRLIEDYSARQSQSHAKEGEILPPAPFQQGDPAESEFAPPEPPQPVRPLALEGIDLTLISSRADLVSALSDNLPINEIGLPRIIFRSDLLDWTAFARKIPEESTFDEIQARYSEMQSYLDIATVYLSYLEGFPAYPGGEALWGKLPFEYPDAYSAFTQYCELPGARQITKVTGYAQEQVREWFHEFYWAIRVRCFDMMHTVHAAKMREQRILSCEDDHYLQAENLFNRLKLKIPELDLDALAADPKAFVDVLEKVAKIQRMSLGLSQTNAGSSGQRQVTQDSVELSFKKVAQPNLPALRMKQDNLSIRELLKNPDALSSAQELIIRMTQTHTRSTEEQ